MALLGLPFLTSVRFHWPMQGPQALASTVPPTFSNRSRKPSRSMVALHIKVNKMSGMGGSQLMKQGPSQLIEQSAVQVLDTRFVMHEWVTTK